MEKAIIKPEELFKNLQELVNNYVVTTEKMDEMTEQVIQQQKEGFLELQKGITLFFEQTKGATQQWDKALEQFIDKENNPKVKEMLQTFTSLNGSFEQAMVNTTTNSLQLMQQTHEQMAETLQLMMNMQKENRSTAQHQLQSVFDFWNTSTEQFLSAMKETAK